MKKEKMEKFRSVVYSFNGRWEEPLSSGEVKVFFRKRRPVINPSRVFFYIGVPVKKVIGFADVTIVEPVDLAAAIRIKRSGAISENELIAYIGQVGTVNAIWIGKPTIFQRPFPISDLHELYGFNPPQSFSNVSTEFEGYLLSAMQ